jgi:hypothetical protein
MQHSRSQCNTYLQQASPSLYPAVYIVLKEFIYVNSLNVLSVKILRQISEERMGNPRAPISSVACYRQALVNIMRLLFLWNSEHDEEKEIGDVKKRRRRRRETRKYCSSV